MGRDVLSRIDREHKHVRIAWLWPDPAAFERLLCHFEELTSSPVLINKELRLNVVAKSGGWVFLYRNTPTALALHDAGHKPATRLCTRQSFLLIVRTRHVVTVVRGSDRTLRYE